MGEIRITLETLYDLLRNEKKREDLQKLEETFFVDVVAHLKEKQALLDSLKDDGQLFAAGEKQKLGYEVRSIKRILKELYERREKKIIEIALNRSKTGSDIIDTSAMLKEEKEFYGIILTSLDQYRQGILMNLLKGELPGLKIISGLENKKQQLREELESMSLQKFTTLSAEPAKNFEEPQPPHPVLEPSTTKMENNPPASKTKIKFIRPVPSFVWKDMKVYGPFDAGEEIEIFPEVAELLVRKGRAGKV